MRMLGLSKMIVLVLGVCVTVRGSSRASSVPIPVESYHGAHISSFALGCNRGSASCITYAPLAHHQNVSHLFAPLLVSRSDPGGTTVAISIHSDTSSSVSDARALPPPK